MHFGGGDWVCVHITRTKRAIAEAELVLISVGIETQISPGTYGWRLYTREHWEETARQQLLLYKKENQPRQRQLPFVPLIDNGYWGSLGFLATIWLIPALSYIGVISGYMEQGAALHAEAVANGEWWRTVTALTLHADFQHILVNSISGALLGLMCARSFGSGFTWLVVLVCGALANYINASLQPEAFRAIGASTAVFAAAGVLCSFNWRTYFDPDAGFRRNFLPIAAAIGLFLFMGIGGENTDVAGHFWGLFVGLFAGLGLSFFDARRLGHSGQVLSGALAAVILITAWLHTSP